MTQSGEELTLKGEYDKDMESVFSFNKSIESRYSMDAEDRERVTIQMHSPDYGQLETFQMIFVLKGSIGIARHGQAVNAVQINSQQHNLCRVALQHARMVMGNIDDEVICIHLSPAFINRYLPRNHPAYHQLMVTHDGEMPAMFAPFNMHITPEIGAILQRLDNLGQSGFCDQLLLESKVIELLALQVTQFEVLQTNAAPPLKKEELERMQQAREILIHHTGVQLSLRSLAHLVGTNEFNLKRDFKTVFGNTVYGYLNQYKMEKAKSMLIAKDITIAETAKEVGYKHATHFTSAFKKYFGYLPNKIKSGKLSLLIFAEDFFMLFDHLCCLMIS